MGQSFRERRYQSLPVLFPSPQAHTKQQNDLTAVKEGERGYLCGHWLLAAQQQVLGLPLQPGVLLWDDSLRSRVLLGNWGAYPGQLG